MKNRKCPSHKACLDYDNGNCQNCVFGETIIKLYKRVDRLKKSVIVLTEDNHILATEFKDRVIADTVRKMQERLKGKSEIVYGDRAICVELIDQIAKEMLGEV